MHIGSTRHWHTHNDKIDFVMEILESKQTIDLLLIKIFKFCIELILRFYLSRTMVLQLKYSFILMYTYSFQTRNIFSPIGMLYNILLVINQ